MPNTTVIAVVSTKGGVGKTTLAANIGGLLAALGQRVLLMDADVGQASLTRCFRLAQHPTAGMADLIASGGLVQAHHFTPTTRPNLHIVANNIGEDAQEFLRKRGDGQFIIKRAVKSPLIRERYDFVLIDTQGTKGDLQRCAATAADLLLSPFKPGPMELAEFKPGTLEMLRSLNCMSDFMADLRVGPVSVVINCAPRTTVARHVSEHLRTEFRDEPGVRVLDTFLPDAKAYPEARALFTPVHESDPPGNTKVQLSGYEVMHRLVFELAPHLKGLWTGVNLDAMREAV